MIYLVQYDRQSGTLRAMHTYGDAQRGAAEQARLALEVEKLHAGVTSEIVILEAANEVELRKTHRRYFEPIEQLLRAEPLPATSQAP